MELMFYGAHRMLHEINFLWASHQYHHSSRQFNLGTALRLSWFELNIVYYYTSLLAIAIPPPIMISHMQYMFLYQAWLHTETIGKLGFFVEFIFNTPSHHRVHHVFDRLFGTYADELEPPVYGITTRVSGHQIIGQQLYYYLHIGRKIHRYRRLRHKLLAIFAGPGWRPGAPRLGFRNDDIPDVIGVGPKPGQLANIDSSSSTGAEADNIDRLDLPLWQVMYTSFTCVITVIGFYMFANHSLVFLGSQHLSTNRIASYCRQAYNSQSQLSVVNGFTVVNLS
ncbi:alkylglycerol monooxygenase-like [Oppia nitens]|uniref:alkylglycerol monooxygenase-like n=1 Tax=Oppia nitens TaxID=1686743 RepID=UPI0023DC95D7|nr:alkylglycerol monooxygenase-like [Oppia nitens]